MSDELFEMTTPAGICAECFGHRREIEIPSPARTRTVVFCFCGHSSTAGAWSADNGWVLRSPVREEAYTAIIDQAMQAYALAPTIVSLREWIADRCTFDADARAPVDALFRDYETWLGIEARGAPLQRIQFEITLQLLGLRCTDRSGRTDGYALRVVQLA